MGVVASLLACIAFIALFRKPIQRHPGVFYVLAALAMNTEILLFDEPFGALDVKTRRELQDLMQRLWLDGDCSKTAVFVTHDIDEALLLADRIVFTELFECAISSLQLLLGGYILGMALGVVFGVICGWVPRLREMFYPIANVLAPIPSVIYTPFLVIVMPTYRLAALMIILLGIFWPQFLNTILRVGSLPPAIVDNARVLKVGNVTMIKDIILPFIVPDVLKGMRVSLTTGFLMLMYAESFGTRSGIGYFISNTNVFANYANIFAGIIVCAIVVTVLNYATAWVQRKFTACVRPNEQIEQMQENMNEEVKQLVDRVADECLRGAHQPKDIILTLLALDPASEEVFYMKEKACELAHAITNNQASISGAIGVDMCSCDMNCKFCSFGTEWGLVAEDVKFEKPEIISMVREYVESGATTITLRCSTCVEPLGIEHTDEEIADKILENLTTVLGI